VDIARSRTRRAQEKLRLAQARYAYHESMLKLARVMVLPMEQKIRLADSLDYFEDRTVSPQEAIAVSEKTRLEIKLSQQNVRVEKKRLDGARFQYLPKVEIDADYGSNGPQLNEKKAPTGQGMILGKMPIFEGGMIQGQIRQAASRIQQSEMELEDTGRQVEEDVRLALRRLETGKEKVAFAGQALELAKREMSMTADRFASGVSDNVEVLSSQTVLTGARDDYLAALADYHASRMNLYWALGQPEAFNLKVLSTKEKNP
jgi:outer membrane protein TolC